MSYFPIKVAHFLEENTAVRRTWWTLLFVSFHIALLYEWEFYWHLAFIYLKIFLVLERFDENIKHFSSIFHEFFFISGGIFAVHLVDIMIDIEHISLYFFFAVYFAINLSNFLLRFLCNLITFKSHIHFK